MYILYIYIYYVIIIYTYIYIYIYREREGDTHTHTHTSPPGVQHSAGLRLRRGEQRGETREARETEGQRTFWRER